MMLFQSHAIAIGGLTFGVEARSALLVFIVLAETLTIISVVGVFHNYYREVYLIVFLINVICTRF